MTDPLDPVPPELQALFEHERAAPPMPAGARVRVWGHVAAALPATVPAPSRPGAVQAARNLAARKALTVLAALAAGGGAGAVVQHHLDQRGAMPPPVAATPPPPPAPPVGAPAVEPPRAVEPAPHRRAAVPRPSRPEGPDTLAGERTALDTARIALARGDANGALGLLDRYDRDYPRGVLGEEAESLRIQAWTRAGELPQARAAAAAFARKYPKSLQLPAIEQSLQAKP